MSPVVISKLITPIKTSDKSDIVLTQTWQQFRYKNIKFFRIQQTIFTFIKALITSLGLMFKIISNVANKCKIVKDDHSSITTCCFCCCVPAQRCFA